MKAIGEPSRQSYAPLDVGYPPKKEHFYKKIHLQKRREPIQKKSTP